MLKKNFTPNFVSPNFSGWSKARHNPTKHSSLVEGPTLGTGIPDPQKLIASLSANAPDKELTPICSLWFCVPVGPFDIGCFLRVCSIVSPFFPSWWVLSINMRVKANCLSVSACFASISQQVEGGAIRRWCNKTVTWNELLKLKRPELRKEETFTGDEFTDKLTGQIHEFAHCIVHYGLFTMNLSTNCSLFPQFVQEQEKRVCGRIHTKLFAQFVDELIRLQCEWALRVTYVRVNLAWTRWNARMRTIHFLLCESRRLRVSPGSALVVCLAGYQGVDSVRVVSTYSLVDIYKLHKGTTFFKQLCRWIAQKFLSSTKATDLGPLSMYSKLFSLNSCRLNIPVAARNFQISKEKISATDIRKSARQQTRFAFLCCWSSLVAPKPRNLYCPDFWFPFRFFFIQFHLKRIFIVFLQQYVEELNARVLRDREYKKYFRPISVIFIHLFRAEYQFLLGRIQDFGQGGPAEFWPQGDLEPKICSKLPKNCMVLKKKWGQVGPGPQAPWICQCSECVFCDENLKRILLFEVHEYLWVEKFNFSVPRLQKLEFKSNHLIEKWIKDRAPYAESCLRKLKTSFHQLPSSCWPLFCVTRQFETEKETRMLGGIVSRLASPTAHWRNILSEEKFAWKKIKKIKQKKIQKWKLLKIARAAQKSCFRVQGGRGSCYGQPDRQPTSQSDMYIESLFVRSKAWLLEHGSWTGCWVQIFFLTKPILLRSYKSNAETGTGETT